MIRDEGPRWARQIRSPRVLLAALGSLLLLALAVHAASDKPDEAKPASAAAAPANAVRVETAVVKRSELPIYLSGLGTVQAFYTTTISPRVDGELIKLGFTEGQNVKVGAVLAQIDPRPYQAALDQAVATERKDQAQLANARLDLERYAQLAPQELASKQTVATQRALVAQLEAQIAADQAVIANARTQLDYTTLRAPIAGRTGIRLVDPGNILHAASATGIVVLTQLQPISVLFTLPAEQRLAVAQAMAAGTLSVAAMSRDGKTALGTGKVALIDNQIDQTTGTIKLKATFPNRDQLLWPGDFVNTRLQVQTRHQALTVPSNALQRGPNGLFAYVVKADNTVERRTLRVSAESEGLALVEQGLNEGEIVTTSNAYRLQQGAVVKRIEPDPAKASGSSAP